MRKIGSICIRKTARMSCDPPNTRRFFTKVVEMIEVSPIQLKVVERFQEVIVLDGPDEPTQFVGAKRPAALLKSFVGPSLWTYPTVSRFADHLPYYRLEDIRGRSDFRIDLSTQWLWMCGLAHGVTLLVGLMWQRPCDLRCCASKKPR